MSAPRQAWMNTPSPMKINNISEQRETSLPPKERYKRKRKASKKRETQNVPDGPYLNNLQQLKQLKKKYQELTRLTLQKEKLIKKKKPPIERVLTTANEQLSKAQNAVNQQIRNLNHSGKNLSSIEKVEQFIQNLTKAQEEERARKKEQKKEENSEKKQKLLSIISSIKKNYGTLKNLNDNNIYTLLRQGRPLVRVSKTMLKRLNNTIQTQRKAYEQKHEYSGRKNTETLNSIIRKNGIVMFTPEVIGQFIKIKDLIIELGGPSTAKQIITLINEERLKEITTLFSRTVRQESTTEMTPDIRELYYTLLDIRSNDSIAFRKYLTQVRILIQNIKRKNISETLQNIIEIVEKHLAKQNNLYYKVITYVKYDETNDLGSIPILNKLNRLKEYTKDKPSIRKDIRLNLDWGQQLDHDPISVSSFVPFLQNLENSGDAFSPNSMFYALLYRSITQNRCNSCPINAKECRGLCDLVLPRSAISVPYGINGNTKEVYTAYGALVHGIISYDKVRTKTNKSLGIAKQDIKTEKELLEYVKLSQQQPFRQELIKNHDMRYGCYVFDDNKKKLWLRLDMNNMSPFFLSDITNSNITLYNWTTKSNQKITLSKPEGKKTFKELCTQELFGTRPSKAQRR